MPCTKPFLLISDTIPVCVYVNSQSASCNLGWLANYTQRLAFKIRSVPPTANGNREWCQSQLSQINKSCAALPPVSIPTTATCSSVLNRGTALSSATLLLAEVLSALLLSFWVG